MVFLALFILLPSSPHPKPYDAFRAYKRQARVVQVILNPYQPKSETTELTYDELLEYRYNLTSPEPGLDGARTQSYPYIHSSGQENVPLID